MQESSYLKTSEYRWESSLGLGIGKYYRLYIQHVSPFIKGDNRGQYYLSPLNFQFGF